MLLKHFPISKLICFITSTNGLDSRTLTPQSEAAWAPDPVWTFMGKKTLLSVSGFEPRLEQAIA